MDLFRQHRNISNNIVCKKNITCNCKQLRFCVNLFTVDANFDMGAT